MKEAERKAREFGLLEAREESVSTLSRAMEKSSKMKTGRHLLAYNLEVTGILGKSNLSGTVGTQAKLG